MELSLIGLQNAGKTSLVNVVAVSKLDNDYELVCCSFCLLVADALKTFIFVLDGRIQ